MQGYPTSLISPGAFSTATTETRSTPIHNAPGYIQSFSLGTQVQLDRGSVLTISYVGSHGVHIPVQGDYNEAPPQLPGQGLALADRRPMQNFQDIYANFAGGFLRYNSLQINLTHRFTAGLFLTSSFTWSKAFDDASGITENSHGDSQYISIRNPTYYNGLSGYDQRMNSSTAASWKIPFGLGIRNRALRQAATGWTLTTITRVTTGIPWNIYYGADDADETSDLLNYRPNITGSVKTLLNPRSKWIVNNTATSVEINGSTQGCLGYCNIINASQLSQPATATAGGTSPYGNLPRNAIAGPGFINVDLGTQKNFAFFHHSDLQFRADAFNVMNHTNFKAPDLEFNNGSFGEFTGGSGSVFPSRRMQFGVRYSF
jgi:hypothetical protein